MDISHLEIDKEYIKKVAKNNEYNGIIIDYYKKYGYFATTETLQKRAYKQVELIGDCNKFWDLDYYKIQKVKDFKSTNLCKNKFCNNCKKVRQASRMGKFIPLLEPYKNCMYHMTLTVPNCKGKELKDTIKKIFTKFATLIRYFKGVKKIKDIDFDYFGYEGCIRSLEVTFKGDSYHPHLHCAMVFENITVLEYNNINKYSYSYGELRRKFSNAEIIIQKIWYLLINDIRVNKKNIDELEIGYSCTLEKFKDDDYAELFKYMTKETDEEKNVLTYSNFVVLEENLYRVRQIQGYGCFYNIKDDDVSLEEVQEIYESIIQELQKKESPVWIRETPSELLADNTNIIISKNKIFNYLRSN